MRVIGTTAYMSPEQIKGLRVDARADVYALGLMVYEMISGRHPLTQEEGIAGLPRSMEQVALMQLQHSPRPLVEFVDHCPGYISAMVEKAIAKDREKRFPNMTAFSRELRTAHKRHIAENRLDDSPHDPPAGDRLREKFGAPPRQGSNPPPPPFNVIARPQLPIAQSTSGSCRHHHRSPRERRERFADHHGLGSSAVYAARSDPVPAGQVLTAVLSEATLAALPSGPDDHTDPANRVLPPDDVRNQTTHTNPFGQFRASDLTPEPHAIADTARRTLFGSTVGPVMRRAAVTLGLGALIGVPPAVAAVVWSTHRKAPVTVAPVSNVGVSGSAAPASSVALEHFVEVPVASAQAPELAALAEPLPPVAPSALAPHVAAPVAAPPVPRAAPMTPSLARGKSQKASSSPRNAANAAGTKVSAAEKVSTAKEKPFLPPSGL